MVKTKLQKQKWFPRPHDMTHVYAHRINAGNPKQTTIYPICMYDEGLGSPSAYSANPENASFAEVAMPNCYAESRVDAIATEFTFSLTKEALETDKLHVVRLAYMPIFPAFKEDYVALDELSTNETQDILRLQTESTDRQGYPLWLGGSQKMDARFNNSAVLDANVPGLTTNQGIEAVDFNFNTYYDCLQYMTNSGKLKGIQGGLKWITLTKDKPMIKLKISLRSKSKRMNPYTFFGLLTTVPASDNQMQTTVGADVTNINHVSVSVSVRFNEWNQDFNMKKV
jgi:hypothetical protein